MENLDVSVIIPCYNNENQILRAIDSVVSQTHSVLEIIVIDDASQDETIKRIEENYDADILRRIRVYRNEVNRGPSYSRNKGWELAKGNVVAFLDADDVWLAEKIKLQVGVLELYPDIVLVGGLYSEFPMFSEENGDIVEFPSVNQLLLRNWFATPTVVVKKDIEYRFDENQRYCEDYLLWLTIGKHYKVAFINTTLSHGFKHSFGDSGLSSNMFKMYLGELTAYVKFFRGGGIRYLYIIPVFLFSTLKFLRRFLIISKRLVGGGREK